MAKTLYVHRDKIVAIQLATDTAVHSYGTPVLVADNFVAGVGDTYVIPQTPVYPPTPVATSAPNFYGTQTQAWVTLANQAVAEGKNVYGIGSTVLVSDGVNAGKVLTLQGVGTSAAFGATSIASSVNGLNAATPLGAPSFTQLPTILLPTIVGVAPAFSDGVVAGPPKPTLTGNQWSLDGVDTAGDTGTNATPQTLANATKVLRVKQTARNSGGTTSAVSQGAIPGMQNWKSSNTQSWQAMRNGGVRGRIIVWGDSYPAGFGAGANSGGSSFAGARASSWPVRLAALLTAGGIPASANYVFGSNALATSSANLALLDPRLTFQGGGTLGGFPVLGGDSISLGGATDKETFTPGVTPATPGGTFDTVEIMALINPQGQGNFLVSLDGGATVFATIINNDATANRKIILTVPPATTSVTLMHGTGGAFFVYIGVRTSNLPGVEIYQSGVSGVTLQTLATPTGRVGTTGTEGTLQWNSRAGMKALCDSSARNLIIINGWYNDRSSGRTLAQASADLSTLIAEAQTYGDVVYCGYAGLDTGAISLADFRLWQDAMLAIAVNTFNIPVFDMSRVITDYASNSALYFNNLHLGLQGHPYAAAQMATQMMQPFP